jgi:16S rRNA (cytosine1402-N4)-methyltransferase
MSYPAYQYDHLPYQVDNAGEASMPSHTPVLLNESVTGLHIKANGIYLDATFGRGGHSRVILNQLGEQGQLMVLDRDPQAISAAHELAATDDRVQVLAGTFSQLGDLMSQDINVDGALFDLGISSPQIDQSERGFSFQQDGPIDMRMNNAHGMSAADWLNRANADEIAWVLTTYGEERFGEEIAKQIVQARARSPIKTTKQLVEVILAVVPSMAAGKHPATKVFQAIRMHINDELEEIRAGLPIVTERMNNQARLVVISYHSIEHQLVSDVLKRKHISEDLTDSTSSKPKLRKVGHAIRANRDERLANRRARSALLRIWEKKDGT